MRFDAGRARPALAGGAAPRGRRAPVVMAVSNRADLRPVGERSPRPFRARGSLGADARKGLFGRAGGLDRRADRVERPCDRGNGVLDPGATRSFHDRAQRQILLPAMRADPGGRPEGRGAALDLLVFRAWRPALGARKAADGEFSSRKRSRTPPIRSPDAAADAEGEARLRRVLRSWPWATRSRIDTHLRGLQAAKSAAKITSGRPNRRQFATQFHKLCANPTNFGTFRPINCEFGIPKLCMLRPLGALKSHKFRLSDSAADRRPTPSGAGAAVASKRAPRAALSDASAVCRPSPRAPSGAVQEPSGPDLSVFSIACAPDPNRVR